MRELAVKVNESGLWRTKPEKRGKRWKCLHFCLHSALFQTPNRPGTLMDTGLERVKGIEPSYAAWEAAVLPLNYTRGNLPVTLTRK